MIPYEPRLRLELTNELLLASLKNEASRIEDGHAAIKNLTDALNKWSGKMFGKDSPTEISTQFTQALNVSGIWSFVVPAHRGFEIQMKIAFDDKVKPYSLGQYLEMVSHLPLAELNKIVNETRND